MLEQGIEATLTGYETMKYLIAITIMLGSLTLVQPAQANGSSLDDCARENPNNPIAIGHCRESRGIPYSEIDDVEPLTETAQGGDGDNDAGSEGDFGEGDRAAASTAAE